MSISIESLHGPWPWAASAQYSQAVRVGDTVHTGGIGGFDAEGELVPGGIAEQTRQALRNLSDVLHEFGAGLENIASMTVFVVDRADYGVFKEIRPEFLTWPFPASIAVAAGGLLVEGMVIEMSAVAIVDGRREAWPVRQAV
jgi:2-iminobutanoate/2-iminopropanoate deaminase